MANNVRLPPPEDAEKVTSLEKMDLYSSSTSVYFYHKEFKRPIQITWGSEQQWAAQWRHFSDALRGEQSVDVMMCLFECMWQSVNDWLAGNTESKEVLFDSPVESRRYKARDMVDEDPLYDDKESLIRVMEDVYDFIDSDVSVQETLKSERGISE